MRRGTTRHSRAANQVSEQNSGNTPDLVVLKRQDNTNALQ